VNGNFSRQHKNSILQEIKFDITKLILLVLITIASILLFYGQIPFICPVKSLTGFNCSMCGSTRSIHLLLNFHFIESFKMNPLALMWLFFIGLSYIKLCFEIFNIKIFQSFFELRNKPVRYTLIGLSCINMLYLNIF